MSKRNPSSEEIVSKAKATRPPSAVRLGIRASAGSGKTHGLMVRYLKLVAAGSKPEEVLATTFTRKAAGEILARIVKSLAEGVLDATKRKVLGEHLRLESLDETTCRRLFDEIVTRLDRVRISTLDSLFANAARQYALELGIPPGWTVLESVDDVGVRREAIDDTLAELGAVVQAEIARNLSQGDVERSVHAQIDTLVMELHDLFCESSEAAWHAIPQAAELDATTLESLAEELARAPLPKHRSIEKSRDDDVELIRAADWRQFVSGGMSAKVASGETTFHSKPISEELLHIYGRLNGHARAFFQNRLVRQCSAMHRILREFDGRYRANQLRSGGLRFSDVTRSLAPRGLFGDREDPPAALLEHARGVRHILIDEFQDTSLLQWEVLEPLARECLERRNGTFFCVGDPKQAIYQWRGGVAELMDELDERLGKLEWHSLPQSRRSSPVVVDAVNRVFGSLANNPVLADETEVLAGWRKRFEIHTAYHGSQPGYVRLIAGPEGDEGDSPAEAAMRFTADEIWRLHSQTPRATIGVLTRTNKIVDRLLVELSRRGVPASEEGGNPLTKSAAVLLVLSLMAWLDHPGDTASRFHVATSPLGPLIGLKRQRDDEEDAAIAHRLRRELSEKGYAATVRRIVGLIAGQLDAREQDRLERLVELAIEHEGRATTRPVDFVRFVENRQVEDPTPAPVRVMTVHQAKGLEFDIVVLPELDGPLRGQAPPVVIRRDGSVGPVVAIMPYVNEMMRTILGSAICGMFDHFWAGITMQSLCHLYVAMTRAKYALHMIVTAEEKAKKELPATYAGVLRGGLTAGEQAVGERVLFESGDPDWHAKVTFQRDEPAADVETIEATGIRIQRSPAAARTSPSRLEEVGSDAVAQLLRVEDSGGLRRGSVFHEWFAAIGWLEDGIPNDEELLRIAGERHAGAGDFPSLLSEFHEYLERPAVKAAFSRVGWGPGELTVFRERPILVRVEDRLVHGKVDRLVVARANGRAVRAAVIDFKTDRLRDAGGAGERARVYSPQIEAYRAAVAKMLRLPMEKVEGRLVFVEVGVSVAVG